MFHSYQPYKGGISSAPPVPLIAFETGEAVGYGPVQRAEGAAPLFIGPGTQVYEGHGVIGERTRAETIWRSTWCRKSSSPTCAPPGSGRRAAPDPAAPDVDQAALESISDDELLGSRPRACASAKRSCQPSA